MTPSPVGAPESQDVTALLLRWSAGDAAALPRLLPLVYAELRRIAGRQMRRVVPDQTLDPTELVHEVYLRLVDQARANWINRAQFFAVAASLMRRIIVDHARARGAEKRGGGTVRVSMEKLEDFGPRAQRTSETFSDVIAINAALDALAAFDPEQARLVELRFFAGLTVTEAAAVLQRSPRTVKREWRLARAWLLRALR